jgi:hypothetical protein
MARVAHVKALIALIAGNEPATPLADPDWREVLAIGDRTLSTLLLRDAPGAPEWFREEVVARSAKWMARRQRLFETYTAAADALDRSGVEFVLIKGFTHEIDAHLDPTIRVQGDIDLLCSRGDVPRAQRTLCEAGFVPHDGSELSDNHAVPLLRPHKWAWRGDYYDPEMPVPIEVHHTIWDRGRDRIEVPHIEKFWERRDGLDFAGLQIPVFCKRDRLTIAALHLLRHVLRNNVRPAHAWELHRMMSWADHDLTPLESLACRLSRIWFGGDVSGLEQPPDIEEWLSKSAWSPITNLVEPNKDVLTLHLQLLSSWGDRATVLKHRLAPLRLPAHDEAAGSYAAHVAKRLGHHAIALARTLGFTRDSSTSHTSD